MTRFLRQLAALRTGRRQRRWIFVPYDQLTDRIGPLSREDPRELGIVLIECPQKAARRPYHRQKLALILANMRHFALEQAARGVAIRHIVAEGSYSEALAPLVRELGPLRVMEPAERELREDLKPLIAAPGLQQIAHEGWLTTAEQFRRSHAGPPWRMDAFYRFVRRDTGILMEQGKPVGGKFSHDAENRKPWRGEPPAPSPPCFCTDEITQEVGELIESRYATHPGQLRLDALPATKRDADALWSWARQECLASFGPFEDAMSVRSRGLFHTRVSSLVNIGRLLPRELISDVLAMALPLSSREGFVRQLLGWREFVRHIHRETDGFRSVRTDVLGNGSPLPPAYWGRSSGLACLDRVVADVWLEGWSHHITRLMVLSNVATLLDFSPRELTDWFWIAYTDAFDWVVEPNVLAMGTYAVGDLMTTKPYIAGAAYINRMSDYCGGCAFDPKVNCPITPLYWAFLARHADELGSNPRLFMPYNALRKRTIKQKREDQRVFATVSAALARGDVITPPTLPRKAGADGAI